MAAPALTASPDIPAPARSGPLRALMLAFEFPPLAAGGVYRAAAMAARLPEHGIELDVVTVRPEDYREWSSAPHDETLLARLPESVRVHRIPSGFPAWYWRASRSRLGFRALQLAHWGDAVSLFWRRPLFALLDRLVAERRPEVLLATVPPFGVAVLAAAAARRYRLPWVVDWRDPWTLWCVRPYPSYAHYRYARAHEGRCLRRANAAVATSHVTRDDWLREFRGADPSRLAVIYNGYEPETMAAVAAAPARETGSERRAARIVYVGSFYYTPDAHDAMMRPFWRRPPHRWLHYRKRIEDWRYRSPYYFLRGLARCVARWPELRDRLEVVFAGQVPPWLPAMLAETGTTDLVSLAGVLPHREALALQADADALLLTSALVPGGRDYSIAGKTYEYLAFRKPILGVLTDGAMRDLVDWSGLGILANPDDPDDVARAIRAIALGEVAGGARTEAQESFVGSLTRERMAAGMAELLRRAAGEGYRA